ERCIYSGRKIGISDFVSCEIDHIFPRTDEGNDALYNKVLCYNPTLPLVKCETSHNKQIRNCEIHNFLQLQTLHSNRSF
ncbi:MAG: hypothetical protein J6W55_01550, partial [Acidaminococcaceae bacterium]|nr:hypothetical protein [Acidaminococcaceae bacterium]